MISVIAPLLSYSSLLVASLLAPRGVVSRASHECRTDHECATYGRADPFGHDDPDRS